MTEVFATRARLAIVSAIAGFIANLTQVALFRFFMGQFYGTEIHLGLFLSIWLLGIAMGGFVGGKTNTRPITLINLLTAIPILVVLIIYLAPEWLPSPGGKFIAFAPVALFMLLTVAPVAFVFGMFIPAMIRITRQSIGYFYSLEALGGFVGGIFFSLVIGGKANATLCLLCLPIMALTGVLVEARRKLIPALLLFAAAPTIFFIAPAVADKIEQRYWQKIHGKTSKLEATVETPYQKLQLSSYWEQKSLFSNGMLTDSWPAAEAAESRVHTFVSALENFQQILIIGAPTPDVIAEFIKYPELELTIVEGDKDLIELFAYPPEQLARAKVINVDPRLFLNQSREKFDGIMFNAISPVTLAGNRLFTLEALRATRNLLNSRGVVSLQVQGAENYLDQTLGRVIISTWQALRHEFTHCLAIPGNVITMFASQSEKVLPQGIHDFSNRLTMRKIATTTFFPMSFYNLLMPHRVKELEEWLRRDMKIRLNTDAHPVSFIQQIELWNIYSGSTLNSWLQSLQQIPFSKLLTIFLAVAAAVMLLPALFSTGLAVKTIVAGGVAISGATGILSEIILILMYQNRYGAAYQMTALFFGIYMMGLAAGAMLFGHVQQRELALFRLKLVKILQILFTVFCIFFVDAPDRHTAAILGFMIFAIAFLDGIEFPVADSILRSIGRHAADSAGLLISADNSGALIAGALSGLWLLPAIGMADCFSLLSALLVVNLAGLLIFSRRLSLEKHGD